jgi:phenylacetate-CoA ligase
MEILKKFKDISLTMGGLIYFHLKAKHFIKRDSKYFNQYQLKRLRKLLRKAEKSIYYKRLFLDLNFVPDRDFKSIEDLNKLPILNKNNVKSNPLLFLTRKMGFFDQVFHTSGSTGKAMNAYISWKHWIVEQGVIYRHWSWHGYKFRDKTAMIRSYVGEEGKLWKYNYILNTFYYSPFHLNETNLWDYYNHMFNWKPKVIRGYPSSVYTFAKFMDEKKIKLTSVKIILVASEVLTDEQRNLIEKVFNIRVANHYGLAEQIVMMGNDEQSPLMHNYPEYGYVEFIPTKEENIYRIIGTNLHNELMPLIRYDTGDLAIGINSTCDCKKQVPTIKAIIGRRDQNIDAPNGSSIPTVNFYSLMSHHQEIDEWQIITEKDSFTLCVKGEVTIETKEAVITGLNKRLYKSGYTILLKQVDELQKISEGKTPIYIKK